MIGKPHPMMTFSFTRTRHNVETVAAAMYGSIRRWRVGMVVSTLGGFFADPGLARSSNVWNDNHPLYHQAVPNR